MTRDTNDIQKRVNEGKGMYIQPLQTGLITLVIYSKIHTVS